MSRNTVFQREGDPHIYLNVMNEWYCYNPASKPLGAGAMGTVYLGYRCSNGEKIAIKRVKDAYANTKSIRERAKQEASLAFRHDNLVEMIGYCECAPSEGPIFLLSKFVSGMELDKYVEATFHDTLTRTEKICYIVCCVLDALQYIHSRGVIHRDIKPSNIMVEEGSNVRLMDLGIARMNGGNKFSSFGFIGTPQYAAPEQIARPNDNSIQINASTDLYELGITFYEILDGSNPYDCPTEVETLTKQMVERLPKSDKIPARLMQVIWQATEKEQNKRYQTALDFKKAIQQALLPEPSFIEKLTEWIDKNALLLGIISGLILTILLFIFI